MTHDDFCRDHFFDLPERVKANPRHKTADISGPHQVSRGTVPVRTNQYKTDESKISKLKRMGKPDDIPNDEVLQKFN